MRDLPDYLCHVGPYSSLSMGELVLLVPTGSADVPIGSTAIEALARLGVTAVSLAADSHTTAIILQGWAFDPDRSSAAIEALGGSPEGARTLQLIAHVDVTATPRRGGIVP